MKNKLISIVIPIHNEEKILERNITEIVENMNHQKVKYEVILIENGSTDKTYEVASKISEKYNHVGLVRISRADYGKALKVGMVKARGYVIVNYDLDFYDVDFAMQALALEPFGYDIIVASKNLRLSRDFRSSNRRIISSIYKYFLYYGFGLNVSDTHGIKAWRNDSILRRLIQETTQTKEIFDTELIIRSQYAKRKLLELPITITETRKSVSRILPRVIRGAWQLTKLWFLLKLKTRL